MVGCSAPRTIIQEKEILIDKTFRDTITIDRIKIDSIFIFEKIIEQDTIFHFRIDTVTKKIEYTIKPKPFTITITDTIQVVDTLRVKEPPTFFELFYNYLIAFALGFIVAKILTIIKV